MNNNDGGRDDSTVDAEADVERALIVVLAAGHVMDTSEAVVETYYYD